MPFTREDGSVERDVECENYTQMIDIEHRLTVGIRRPMVKARKANAIIVLAAYQ